MTKTEKLRLHSLKCEMETTTPNMGSGPENLYIVKMSLTPGQLLALNNALTEYDTAVGRDLLAFLQNAATKSGIRL
jgi:hypothetical protein